MLEVALTVYKPLDMLARVGEVEGKSRMSRVLGYGRGFLGCFYRPKAHLYLYFRGTASRRSGAISLNTLPRSGSVSSHNGRGKNWTEETSARLGLFPRFHSVISNTIITCLQLFSLARSRVSLAFRPLSSSFVLFRPSTTYQKLLSDKWTYTSFFDLSQKSR